MPDSATTSPANRFRPLAQMGLRVRIVISFALLAAFISAILIATTIVVSRNNLLRQRESLATDRARVNAVTVNGAVGGDDADVQTLLGSLSTAGRPSIVIRAEDGTERTVSLDPRYGADAVPTSLVSKVLDDRNAGVMRYSRNGQVLLAVGAPLTDRSAGYFEIWPLDDISDSVRSLTRYLLVAALATTAVGAGLGWWASRRVLRPLADIATVAQDIADGTLDARVAYSEWADDPDLAPLVSSFNEMVGALQSRIDRDARFASDVSHELRSPLTTFNASLEVLRNAREEMPERAQTALDLLSSDMARFTQLVEDLLEISRFDAGAVRLELDEVLVVDTVEIAVRTLASRPVPVVADDELREVIALLDKRRLVRILANFIDNAEKYGEGVARVTVDRIPAPPAEDDVDAEPDRVRIGVEDQGSGVPEAEREQIFDRFNRGGQGGSRGSDLGVGLGLALAAEHAGLMSGSVWVEDRPRGETGARFVMELPLLVPDDHPVGEPDGGVLTTTWDEPHDLADVVRTGEHRALVADQAERLEEESR